MKYKISLSFKDQSILFIALSKCCFLTYILMHVYSRISNSSLLLFCPSGEQTNSSEVAVQINRIMLTWSQ